MKNTKILLNTLFAATCAFLISSKTFAEPVGLNDYKDILISYKASGTYDREIQGVVENAETYIKQAITENKTAKAPQKLAIVMDIDETILSNFPLLYDNRFCVDTQTFIAYIAKAKDRAIEPMLSLYQHAIKQGVSIFFVTGRRTPLLAATTKNLKAAGYTKWSGLYFRPEDDKQQSVVPYKTKARETITKSGYHIIAAFGDQQSDLTGGFADKTFKVPNPFYFLP